MKWVNSLYTRRFSPSHTGRQMSVFDVSGADMGFVDEIEVRRGRLSVSGWVVAAHVRLVLGGSVAEMAPRLHRADVAREKNIAPEVGFVLHLPCTADILAHAEAPGLVFFPMPGAPDIPSLSIPLTET